MQSMTTAVRGTPLVAKAPAARRSRRVVAARAQQLCGLTEEEAAARLALAPPSVQAFIKRWGHREGIEAYAAACEIKWEVALLESTDEVPGHHHETAAESAVHEMLENLPDVVGWENPTERLAAAPSTVRDFILRWGRRDGIDAAAKA